MALHSAFNKQQVTKHNTAACSGRYCLPVHCITVTALLLPGTLHACWQQALLAAHDCMHAR
jgi:hypothetical protein